MSDPLMNRYRDENRWTILGHGKRPHHSLCQCVCGVVREVRTRGLKSGHSRSCGCLARELSGLQFRKWGPHSRGLYQRWVSMRQRCSNPKDKAYKNYGARGIRVCKRWESFGNFLADMGEPPTERHTIERKNNNSGYKPSNCYWATYQEQHNNRRGNRNLSLNGLTMTTSQWARQLGVTSGMLRSRLSRGWPVEEALMLPVGGRSYV